MQNFPVGKELTGDNRIKKKIVQDSQLNLNIHNFSDKKGIDSHCRLKSAPGLTSPLIDLGEKGTMQELIYPCPAEPTFILF